VVNLLQANHNVHAPSRDQLDLTDFNTIDQLDLSVYDIVINCAGANGGAYLGWHNNSWQNQQTQVDVNFTGALLLAKQYTRQRDHGQFIYITSSSVDDPIAYNIFMVASKAAMQYSMNAIKKEYPKMIVTEICPGKIKTGMLKQNYQGTKTDEEIEAIYAKGPALSAQDIATAIDTAIKYKLDKVTLTPH
jgi:short-subunit dehydrogenase